MRIAMLTTLVVLPLSLASCGSRQDSAPMTGQQGQAAVPVGQQGMQGQQQPGMPGEDCPMEVQGAMISAQDIEGGAALVLTTTGDVDQLRSRVAEMAEMHNQPHARMAEHAEMPPSEARVENVEGGARIIFTPQDQSDLAPLRAEVRSHAQQIASGECPMMGGEPTASR